MAAKGPANSSVARIARRTGAPVGSIYHRFASRSALLGAVWLDAVGVFQNDFVAGLNRLDAKPPDHDLIAFVPRWVRRNPTAAKILLLHRRAEFLETKWPASVKTRAAELGVQLADAETRLCRMLDLHADRDTLSILRYAIAGAPIAATRPYIEQGTPPPPHVDQLVISTFHAAIATAKALK